MKSWWKRTNKLTFNKRSLLYLIHAKASLIRLPSGQHQRSVSDAEEDATVPERTKPGTTSLSHNTASLFPLTLVYSQDDFNVLLFVMSTVLHSSEPRWCLHEEVQEHIRQALCGGAGQCRLLLSSDQIPFLSFLLSIYATACALNFDLLQ